MGKNDYSYTGGGITDAEKRRLAGRPDGSSTPTQRDRMSKYNPVNKSMSDEVRSGYSSMSDEEYDEMMKRSAGGSRTFSAKEIRRGYRKA